MRVVSSNSYVLMTADFFVVQFQVLLYLPAMLEEVNRTTVDVVIPQPQLVPSR